MPEPETVPSYEVDQHGNLTRLNGAAVPEGLLYTAITPGVAATVPFTGTEWTIDAAYAHARMLRSEEPAPLADGARSHSGG